jgi:hypothetical protein
MKKAVEAKTINHDPNDANQWVASSSTRLTVKKQRTYEAFYGS